MSETETWTIGRLLQWTTQFLKDRSAESPRLDAEVHGRGRRRDRDVGELLRGRVGDHGAVAVDENPIGERHEEHGRDDRDPRPGLDEPDRRGARVRGVSAALGRSRPRP